MPAPKKEGPKGEEALAAVLASQRLAKYTRLNYLIRIRRYLKDTKRTADGLVKFASTNPRGFEKEFIGFIQTMVGDSSPSTIWIYRDSVKKLLELNRVEGVNWTYISEYLPKHKKFGEDRAPTLEEVKRIVDRADLRLKCVILFLCSSGARIGSVEYLRWRDIEEIEAYEKKFARVTIYRGEPEQYTSFVTPECYEHLIEYKESRERLGEKITPMSFVFVTEPNKRNFDPGRLKPTTAKNLKNRLGELLNEIDIRSTLSSKEGYRNYEFKQVHGFRKFFKTRMEVGGTKPIMTEMMMGHTLGVTSSYMKPTPDELAAEYAKSIPVLTVLSKENVTQDDVNTIKREAALEAMRAVATSFGIDPMKVRVEKSRELGREVTADEETELIKLEMTKLREPKEDPQMIVREDELPTYLNEGWQFVSVLPSQKILVRK